MGGCTCHAQMSFVLSIVHSGAIRRKGLNAAVVILFRNIAVMFLLSSITSSRASSAWTSGCCSTVAFLAPSIGWKYSRTPGTCTTVLWRQLASSKESTTTNQDNIDKRIFRGDWRSSEFATHVVAGTEALTIAHAISTVLEIPHSHHVDNDEWMKTTSTTPGEELSAQQLLHLGAVWFLPNGAKTESTKPTRLNLSNATQLLNEGDYVRIHPNPRRFTDVYKYTWDAFHPTLLATNGSSSTTTTTTTNDKPGVLIDNKSPHFLLIDKPANVPVHSTVDNAIENVVHLIQNTRNGTYTSTPQRLDQNTSGLFVVATSKLFAAYYALLLRKKTIFHLDKENEMEERTVYKKYKCLVCLLQDPLDTTWTMASAVAQLKSYDLLRHYLEPSIRAPKHYAKEPPTPQPQPPNDDNTMNSPMWAESLMKIVHVGDPCALVATPGETLALDLYKTKETMPPHLVGVVEVQVELLTGRTHQIRGQLSAEGFPLVGDAQYGGATPVLGYTDFQPSEQLALQCCELEFLDPDIVLNKWGEEIMTPSDRWNKYRLETGWWTPFIEKYHQSKGSSETTSSADLQRAMDMGKSSMETSSIMSATCIDTTLLPPMISLAPGSHKYVLIKAKTNDGKEFWFVKSASPCTCGGPYHVDVAKDLVDSLESRGFQVQVTGGGRIMYDESKLNATVFGFSYGFGRGDHIKAASLISENSDISATYDLSTDLY